jgi:aminoglycoside phosphotransferase (APT) family kinase protein
MPEVLGQPIARGRTAEIYAWGEGRVLKLFLPGFEGGARYEFDIARAVTANGVPAPEAFDLITVEERPGIVYARVDGEPVAQRLSRQPWQVATMGRLMADVHTAIHRATATGLPSQRERLADQIEQAPGLREAERQQVLERLSALPDDTQVCHGDFHPENVLLTANGPQVIDWTDATLGHPHADVARTSLLVRTSSTSANVPALMRPLISLALSVFIKAYLDRYLAVNQASRADIQAWEVICAAARLRENVPESENVLLQLIRTRLA